MTVDLETAQDEFERWAEGNDLDLDTTGLDDNDRADMDRNRTLITKAIAKGKLVISDDCNAVFSPKIGGEITFYPPTGAAYIAMDKKKKSSDFGKIFASMAEVTRTNAVLFSKMHTQDLKVCIAIWSYFLV